MSFSTINILKLIAMCVGAFVYIVELPRNRIPGPESIYVLNFNSCFRLFLKLLQEFIFSRLMYESGVFF